VTVGCHWLCQCHGTHGFSVVQHWQSQWHTGEAFAFKQYTPAGIYHLVLVGLGFPSRNGSFHHRDAIPGSYWQSEKSGVRHRRVPQLTSRRLRRANWALHHGFSCSSDLANLFATPASSRNLGVSQTCSKARKMGMTSWRHVKLRSTGETAGSPVSDAEKT
jgi:hypothetical protein